MEELKKQCADFFKDKLTALQIEIMMDFLNLAHTQGQFDSLKERMNMPEEIDETDAELNELQDVSHWLNKAHERSEGMER